MTDKSKNMFEDLGRATLRGVRKCPKCGTFNGTRGLSCKNKACRQVFKVPKEKLQLASQLDAVKIICNSNLQIYSVKLNDVDKRRCFVHLPIIEGIEALQDAAEITIIKQSATMCYASSCRKPTTDLCTITLNLNPCSHTHSIINCLLEAQPLVLKKSVLNILPIAEEIKQEIYSLASKSEDLVQRINKQTMVVKCNSNDRHPLGFLHFLVLEQNKVNKKFRILCECQTTFTKPFVLRREKQICIHLYMCVCAFASDAKLLDEFKLLIQSVLTFVDSGLLSTKNVFMNCLDVDPDLNSLKDFFSDFFDPPRKRKIENTNEIFREDDNITMKSVQHAKKVGNPATKKLDANEVPCPVINFDQWLGSVTERINQTMHYQFNGFPEPLVFHVPQVFFDVLQQRISSGSKKKRLPNSVVAFTRKDVLPVGVFSKYTWRINNILQVKRIFDTHDVPLEITQNFMENKDGTYIHFNAVHEKDSAENFNKTFNKLFIKPSELKTFLKVGNMTLDQKEPIPFIIEWIPDILPKTHIGELRIKFEYGHQKNGIVEKRNQISTENVNLSA